MVARSKGSGEMTCDLPPHIKHIDFFYQDPSLDYSSVGPTGEYLKCLICGKRFVHKWKKEEKTPKCPSGCFDNGG
jgi:hypothetical protein